MPALRSDSFEEESFDVSLLTSAIHANGDGELRVGADGCLPHTGGRKRRVDPPLQIPKPRFIPPLASGEGGSWGHTTVVHIPLYFTLSYVTDWHGSTECTCALCRLSVSWLVSCCSRKPLARCSLPARDKECRFTSFEFLSGRTQLTIGFNPARPRSPASPKLPSCCGAGARSVGQGRTLDRRSRRGSCEERESFELRWKAGTTVVGFPGSSTRRACHWTRSCRSSRRLVLRRGLGMMSWQSSISRRRPRPLLQWNRLRASPPRPATGHLLQSLSRSTTSFLFVKRNISFAAQCRPTSSMGALQRAACQPDYLVR